MIVDTHSHLYLPEFDEDDHGAAAVERAIAAGVEKIILPNVDAGTVEPLLTLTRRFPGHLYPAMGLHPTEVTAESDAVIDMMEKMLCEQNGMSYVAVGEIGMDLYWDKTFRDEQARAFSRQARLAAETGLPVIIHCREALAETLEVLKSLPEVPRGVFHSFTGTADDVEAIRETGDFYFGINGIATFKKSTLPEVIPVIGRDRILLETDAPYLAPVPHRGKRNESAYIVNTAAVVAAALGITPDEAATITTDNANRLFNLQ